MADYIISSDATCDLTSAQIEALNVKVIDMSYLVDGVEYGKEKGKLSLSEFYGKMRNGAKTSTSMVNEVDAEEYFIELLKEGKDILHVAFSSGLSGTCACLERVANNLNKTNKNKIYVVDSKNGSVGEGMVVEYAASLRAEGKSIEECVQILNDNIFNFSSYFTVQDLKYLVAGGRISRGAAVIGNVLQIKPIIYANDEGKVVQCGKAIGEKKSLLTLVDKVKQKYDERYNKIYVCHADNIECASLVANKIKAHFASAEVEIGEIGAVMGSHCGPGTVAVFFMGERRE